jgi:hypothetical protein
MIASYLGLSIFSLLQMRELTCASRFVCFFSYFLAYFNLVVLALIFLMSIRAGFYFGMGFQYDKFIEYDDKNKSCLYFFVAD